MVFVVTSSVVTSTVVVVTVEVEGNCWEDDLLVVRLMLCYIIACFFY